ncbi:MAG: outer membrane protein assembly factor BamA [Desulfuromonadales bacterium]|nr:outer membrane protein assembly factor BamA [Desulfuromonadales bacterium]
MRYILVFIVILLFFPGNGLARNFAIDSVRIEGNRHIERTVIQEVLQASPGGQVDEKVINEDLAAIFKLGKFSDVLAEVVIESGLSVLVYRVVERPLVRKVELVGNDEIDTKTLQDLIKVQTPQFYNPRTVFETIETMKDAYVEKGHYAAEIEPDLQVDAKNEATLILRIKEGERVLIDSLRFEGNSVFSDKELRKAIQTKKRWIFSFMTDRGAYNEELLQNDLEIISDMYFNKGYVKVKVKQPNVTIVEDGAYLDILIEVVEGDPYSVKSVDIQGDLIAEKSTLMELNRLMLKEGFSRERLRESMLALNDYYADRGYAYVNIVPITEMDDAEKTITIIYNIEKGVEVYIGRVQIRGNTTTIDKVIRREVTLTEGALYSSSALKESRRRINNLGFFEEVNLNTQAGEQKEVMDIDIDVKGKPTGSFTLGMGYSTVDKFVVQGSVAQQNFLGRGLNMNLSGSLGGTSTTYRFGILNPYFLDTKISLGFDLYKTEREWNDYTEQKTGGDIKFGTPIMPNVRSFFIYRYEQRTITDVSILASSFLRSQEGDSTLSSILASLIRDTLDYRPDPSAGGRSELSLEFAGVGGTEKFARMFLDHRHFFKGPWSTVLSAHGNIGYIQQVAGEPIPVSERIYLGGIRTVRGFKTREVGPRVFRTNDVTDPVTGAVTSSSSDYEYTGGDKSAYFNLEYLFPLVKEAGVKGLFFFDTGNAWSEEENYFESMRYSAGAGIRWQSPMGPLRFEWGYNLDPLVDERQSVFEFSIGNFF